MRDGTCPSCGGAEVYAARNGLGLGDTGDARVALRPHLEPSFRGVAARHVSAEVWAYACASCGLVETRIHDPGALAFIRERWVPIDPGPSSPGGS